jgi:ABC-type glycerol-3-phosphate transport system permease component
MRRALLNTFIVTIPFTLLTVVFSAMAGYAFAKYRFRGRNVIFALLIASMLVPPEVNIPTLYVIFARISWLNTYQVQILPGTASVLGMFMARQYMRSIPDEVLEAASVDGAGHWRKFWGFVMPMSAPVLGAIALLTFVFKFTDYLWPLVMASDPGHEPIMVALPALSTSQTGFIVEYELVLAGCVVVTLPLLLLFLRFQDTLMRGVAAGAVRG